MQVKRNKIVETQQVKSDFLCMYVNNHLIRYFVCCFKDDDMGFGFIICLYYS